MRNTFRMGIQGKDVKSHYGKRLIQALLSFLKEILDANFYSDG